MPQSASRREASRRWREKNPDYYHRRLAAMTPERREDERRKRHDQYARRKARDVDGFRERARESARDYLEKNRDRVNTQKRARYAADPDRHRGYTKDHARRNPDTMNDKHYRRYYGIGLDDYNRMLAEQDGLCAICGNPETATIRGKVRRLSVDHDHRTGKVRQLLCHRCNLELGHFGDDPARLEAAAAYLRKHQDA